MGPRCSKRWHKIGFRKNYINSIFINTPKGHELKITKLFAGNQLDTFDVTNHQLSQRLAVLSAFIASPHSKDGLFSYKHFLIEFSVRIIEMQVHIGQLFNINLTVL